MIKALGAKIYAAWSHRRNRRWINNPKETQEKILKNLIKQGLKTRFGKDHGFEKIKDLNHFRSLIPIRDYEDFRPYIESCYMDRCIRIILYFYFPRKKLLLIKTLIFLGKRLMVINMKYLSKII